jgi:hypothetical protein
MHPALGSSHITLGNGHATPVNEQTTLIGVHPAKILRK